MSSYLNDRETKDLINYDDNDALARAYIELSSLAKAHRLSPIAYSTLRQTGSFKRLPEAYKQSWRQEVLGIVGQQVIATEEFRKVYKELRESGVRVCVLKGAVMRALYKDPEFRTSGDEDLFAIGPHYVNCCKKLEEMGFYRGVDKTGAAFYTKPDCWLKLEMHERLFVNDDDISLELNGIFLAANLTAAPFMHDPLFLTFSDTYALLYVVCHAKKHFITSGFGLRTLCDIMNCLYAYDGMLDRRLVLEELKRVRAVGFFAGVLNALVKHMGFPERMAASWRIGYEEMDSTALMDDIMDAGIYGQSSLNRLHASSAMRAALEGGGLWPVAFPNPKTMRYRYPGLKLERRPYLLPVAWALRFYHYLKERRLFKGSVSARDSIKIAKSRMELLKQYRILDAQGKPTINLSKD